MFVLILLSPSKTQDFTTPAPVATYTTPAFLLQSQLLVAELRKLSLAQIRKLMDISEPLATLNHERYRQFSPPFTVSNAKQAMFSFQGDVYDGLDAATFDTKAVNYAEQHLRILSGLYGVLKPLDLIQPYRLEMKIKLKTAKAKDLYGFWDGQLTQALNEDIAKTKTKFVVNLASEEYFKAIDPKHLKATIITPQFKEKKGKEYKMIGLFAKRARGAMARYIVTHAIDKPDKITNFAEDGYRLNPELSRDYYPVFTRG